MGGVGKARKYSSRTHGDGACMTQWEERISGTSDALLLGEHQVRYGWAREAIALAGTWCDLGCGTAAASSRALADVLPDRVVLIDAEPAALDEAGRAFGTAQVQTAQVDLTSPVELAALDAKLSNGPRPTVITCYEVIEHLTDFGPLIEWLGAQAADGATVAISVPNDVFTSVKNPFHVTMWGSSTVEELRGLLPDDHVLAVQVALAGSAVRVDAPVTFEGVVDDVSGVVPLQYLMGFGPAADQLVGSAVVLSSDVAAHRVWERQREVDNAYYRAMSAKVPQLEARIVELEAQLAAVRSSPT